MRRCTNGHYYDETKHSLCPHCGVNIDLNIGSTMAKRPNQGEDPFRTQKHFPDSNSDLGKTVARIPDNPPKNQSNGVDPGKTVAIIRKEIKLDPVVGWLVCIEGPDKGKDYRIRSERNFIGRSDKMDIAIQGDDTISRENHAIVSYSPKKQQFRVYPGESRGLVYLNDEEVITADILNIYDVIEIGKTKLMFVPFCSDKFQWE